MHRYIHPSVQDIHVTQCPHTEHLFHGNQVSPVTVKCTVVMWSCRLGWGNMGREERTKATLCQPGVCKTGRLDPLDYARDTC